MTDLIVLPQTTEWRRLKALVLDSVSSPITKRVNNLGLDEFIAWYGQEPRAGFTKATVSAWRVALEAHSLGSVSINVRIRAHLETAGLAAHSLLAAKDFAKSGNEAPLEVLMRKTLFGTALFKETKWVPELEEYLDWSDERTVSVSELVGSLDRFLEPDKPAAARQRLRYAVLCEFSHPNLRGFKGFAQSSKTEGGWLIQYTPTEDLGEHGVQMIVEYLLENMRLGYGASEMLRRTIFLEDNGCLRCCPPKPSDVAWIASTIMRLS